MVLATAMNFADPAPHADLDLVHAAFAATASST
jgi:hypothetical protein